MMYIQVAGSTGSDHRLLPASSGYYPGTGSQWLTVLQSPSLGHCLTQASVASPAGSFRVSSLSACGTGTCDRGHKAAFPGAPSWHLLTPSIPC
eukprot:3162250-Rhodomonas_salina.1